MKNTTGLFALQSEDYGGPVVIKRGELVPGSAGVYVDGRPAHDLAGRARRLGRTLGVQFAGAIVVLPDTDLEEPAAEVGIHKGVVLVAVQRSVLANLLRNGLPGVPRALGAPHLSHAPAADQVEQAVTAELGRSVAG